LFNQTNSRNIAYGLVDMAEVGDWEIEDAADFASLSKVLEDLPDGLNTIVGTKGGSLSGGQRQRIALARARIRDPQVFILDASTSALDNINRLKVMEAIREWRRSKTAIIITHDVSQIETNDMVYVLESGQVVQQGYRKVIERIRGSPF
jgi:ATP-binding cassette, subfamily B (MDR/TAP), member 1